MGSCFDRVVAVDQAAIMMAPRALLLIAIGCMMLGCSLAYPLQAPRTCFDINTDKELLTGIDKLLPNWHPLIESKIPVPMTLKQVFSTEKNLHICDLKVGVDTVTVSKANVIDVSLSSVGTNTTGEIEVKVDFSASASFNGWAKCGIVKPTIPGSVDIAGSATLTLKECMEMEYFSSMPTEVLKFLHLTAASAALSFSKFDLHFTVHEENPIIKAVIKDEIPKFVPKIKSAISSEVASKLPAAVNTEMAKLGIKPF